MVMPEEVVSEAAPLSHLLQEVRELVRLGPFPKQLILDAGGGTMGDDVVYFPSSPIEVSPRFQIFFRAWQFFFPPGAMVHPEWCSPGLQHVELREKLGIVWLQNAALDIVAAGPTHSEDPFTTQLKYLAAL